jgi:Holliday junction resolvase-like predicted endonuclease
MARDLFHQAVRHALENDGWIITKDPFSFRYGETSFEVDLAAQRLIAAERKDQRIAVEVKSFIQPSASNEFHAALGQYLAYHHALSRYDPSRVLYLAVPRDTFETFFQRQFNQEIVALHKLRILVYNQFTEVVEAWH